MILSFFLSSHLAAQKKAPVDYVDPFIGTAKSSVLTKWGSEGGTYPGAVAPWGFLQLTPETGKGSVKGYNYSDSAIYFFSCLYHNSGFPSGSTGAWQIMPVDNSVTFKLPDYHRRFSHSDEKARPGYYSVLFRDNNTLVEATATERTGMFRFTFPPHIVPQIFVGNGEQFNAAVRFSESYVERQPVQGGYLVKFAASAAGPKVIILSISASTVSKESAERNIAVEGAAGFDQLRQDTWQKWAKALSVIDISDRNETNKTIFYTALYHSLLMPWIISDVDGNYRGRDGKVHTVSGRAAYGGFSPWDTFRSLHPLLCLLYPEKQRDMVLSMLDIYKQTGYLPIESMTGNHSVPIIVDTYLKGIKGIDSALAYAAMKKSIVDTPFLQEDLSVFQQKGYIPFSYPESVTRSVEYAYDDWALAQYAKQVMHNDNDHRMLIKRSYSYRQLFHPADMFMLPRQENEFKIEPGNSGYKEGDKWIYSYFVPQHAKDLVNLMGGDTLFAERLDTALSRGHILFDNETVFHVPYLFNAANAPHKTQQWIGDIMQHRFKATPGGLPGNDDLGSTSSWYILSAMGIYPVSPGLPEYTVGVPAFDTMRIHLNGGDLVIKRTNSQHPYIKSLVINGQPYSKMSIPHALIAKGGEVTFEMDASPDNKWLVRDTAGQADIEIFNEAVAVKKAEPDELFQVRFSLRNKGSIGTKRVELLVDGKVVGYKHCMVGEGMTVTDSIPCRLYRLGDAHLTLNGQHEMTVLVIKPARKLPKHPQIKDFRFMPLVKKGEAQRVIFTVKNNGWTVKNFEIPIKLNERLHRTLEKTLAPGEERTMTGGLPAFTEGWQTMSIGDAVKKYRVYAENKDAILLDLSAGKQINGSILTDSSGFDNHGHILGKGIHQEQGKLLLGEDSYVEVPNAPSLDVMDTTITMMAWVYPTTTSNGLVDIFTKGDTHVLQVSDSKTLTFFAGGWGRGDCTVPLPQNWVGQWHHIAGVCDGDSLKVYIDGALKGFALPEGHANLSVSSKWTLGRNEEFPFQRIFNGHMDGVKVFAAPLSAAEILEICQKSAYYVR